MALNEEIEGVRRCIFGHGGPEPLESRFYLQQIQDCGQDEFGDSGVLRGVKRCFSITEQKVCTECDPVQPAKYCQNHPSSTYENREFWKIHPEKILDKWMDWVSDSTVFQEVDTPDKLGENRFVVRATFDSSPIRLHIFMSKADLDAFNFDLDTPEFGIAFLAPEYVENSVNSSRTYTWSEVFTREFAQSVREELNKLSGSHGDTLLRVEDYNTKKRFIENNIRSYLELVGYNKVENNVGAHCPEAKRYELDLSSYGDFVAMKSDNEKIVACNCDSVNGYHVHRFTDNKLSIASGENGPEEIDHLVGEIKDMANKRATIDDRTEKIQSFVSLATGVAAVTAILSLFGNVDEYSDFIGQVLGAASIPDQLGFLLLTIAIISIILIVVMTLVPFIWEYRFDWEVEPK